MRNRISEWMNIHPQRAVQITKALSSQTPMFLKNLIIWRQRRNTKKKIVEAKPKSKNEVADGRER